MSSVTKIVQAEKWDDEQWSKEYDKKENRLRELYGHSVAYMEFYKAIFPDGTLQALNPVSKSKLERYAKNLEKWQEKQEQDMQELEQLSNTFEVSTVVNSSECLDFDKLAVSEQEQKKDDVSGFDPAEKIYSYSDKSSFNDGRGVAFCYYTLGIADYQSSVDYWKKKYNNGKITKEKYEEKIKALEVAYYTNELAVKLQEPLHQVHKRYFHKEYKVWKDVYSWQGIHDGLLEIHTFLNKCRAYITPVTYFGKKKDMHYYKDIHAIVIDIDLVTDIGLENLIYLYNRQDHVKPTYIVNSGRGIHLYFILDKPIKLHRSIDAQDKLNQLKKLLGQAYWKYGDVSSKQDIDTQDISQGYSVVGTNTKLENKCVTAYKVGEVVTIESLFDFVKMKNVLPFEYKLTLEEAKAKHPDWTPKPRDRTGMDESDIAKKTNELRAHKKMSKKMTRTPNRPNYTQHRGVYDVEKERLRVPGNVKYGKRYWCMWCLAVTAVKCGISKKEFIKDAWEIGHFIAETVERSVPFTDSDIVASFSAYDEAYLGVRLDIIDFKSGITRPRNVRKNNKQDKHCAIMRAILATKRQYGISKDTRFGARYGNTINKNGRPKGSGTAEQTVREYLQNNPDAKKSQVIKETGLSKPTVYKWYNKIKEEQNV